MQKNATRLGLQHSIMTGWSNFQPIFFCHVSPFWEPLKFENEKHFQFRPPTTPQEPFFSQKKEKKRSNLPWPPQLQTDSNSSLFKRKTGMLSSKVKPIPLPLFSSWRIRTLGFEKQRSLPFSISLNLLISENNLLM